MRCNNCINNNMFLVDRLFPPKQITTSCEVCGAFISNYYDRKIRMVCSYCLGKGKIHNKHYYNGKLYEQFISICLTCNGKGYIGESTMNEI